MRSKAIVVVGVAFVGAFAVLAYAQHFDARRPQRIVVGPRHGGSPGDRVDWGRTGLARTPLPTSGIVVEWRRALGATIESSPVVDDAGNVYVIVGRGDVLSLAPDGTERGRAATNVPSAGPPVLLSDGTVVFVSTTGEAIGVRRSAVRFRTRIGRADVTLPPAAPIALDEGGAAVATRSELTLLDSEGNARAHATLSEPIAAPLLSAQGKIIIVGESGAVYAWSLGGGEPVRIGGFGSTIDGAAAMADDHTLVAVTSSGTHLDALDLVRGVTVTRASAYTGFYLGPPAMTGETAHLLAYTDTNTFSITLDATGHELARTILASTPTRILPDGGTPPLALPPHAGVVVDAAGTTAFMVPDGTVGIVTPGNDVDTLGEFICASGVATSTAHGQIGNLAPAGQGSFLVACAGGALAKVSAAKQL